MYFRESEAHTRLASSDVPEPIVQSIPNKKYETPNLVKVLEDPNIRVKLSEYSNWPTIPQLFVKGELIGGCDIIVELHNSNELEKILR